MASPPSAEATLHPRFGGIGEARQATIAARSTFFRRTHPRWLLRASVDRWDGLHQVLATRGDCPRKKLSSGNCSRHAPPPTLRSNFWDTVLGDAEVDGNCAEAATPVAGVAQPRLLH